MLTVEFFNARHGDSCLAQWTDRTGQRRTLLVDGGPAVTYREILLERLGRLRRPVDVICVSHLDEDHIGGVLQLLRGNARAVKQHLAQPIPVRELWFNTLDQLLAAAPPTPAADAVHVHAGAAPADAVIAASYQQGNQLRTSAAELGLTRSASFAGLLRQGGRVDLHDLDVHIIGPDDTALGNLRSAWLAATGHPQATNAVGAAFDDRSVPNLSSISMHLTYQGRTVLLTGDARGDAVLAGLRAAGLLTDSRPVCVDVLKLPHHGSAHNTAPEFFQHIHASHYVISANGKHGHPDPDTLRWLVASRSSQHPYTVHLTNHVPAAVDELLRLQAGRAFTIATRPTDANGITVSL